MKMADGQMGDGRMADGRWEMRGACARGRKMGTKLSKIHGACESLVLEDQARLLEYTFLAGDGQSEDDIFEGKKFG